MGSRKESVAISTRQITIALATMHEAERVRLKLDSKVIGPSTRGGSEVNPLVSLAVSTQSNRGVYALLLGSGVSRAAEIPTGWDVINDLIRRVARLEQVACEPDPATWWQYRTGGRPPSYSELIGQLARSPHERRELLRPYFEPTTEEERDRGAKQPTAAHHAIAELVTRGYVRVIITTNFDRLVERALEEAGVVPTVIATADAVAGAVPLVHNPCTVVKIHGDYVDTRLRNTADELEHFPRPLDRLLDRIFDEFGLIISGWSAEWDPALRAAIERCRSRRYSTYWICRDPARLGEAAQRLVDLRRAIVIRRQSADDFFQALAEHVTSLEELELPHPLSAPLAQQTVKRYVSEDRHRVRLHDLVVEEAQQLHAKHTSVFHGGNPITYIGDPAPEALVQRLQLYERWSEPICAILAAGCYWGGATQHRLWSAVIELLANVPDFPGNRHWLNLRRYPAVLSLFTGGIAAIAAERYDTLGALLSAGTVREPGRETPVAEALMPYQVLPTDVGRLIPGHEGHWVPFSEYLSVLGALREPLRELVPMQERYLDCFDRFEYFLGLVVTDQQLEWNERFSAWVGAFVWRDNGPRHESTFEQVDAEASAAGADWSPLRAGLFGGNVDRWERARTTYQARIREALQWR